MYEYLKELFGTGEDGQPVALTFEQLSEKLTAAKNIKLVNLSEGGYVSKDKFDAKETELAGIKEQLNAANTTIQSYKDMDIEGIKQSAADWEKKYNDDTSALQQKLIAQERAHNEDMFLSQYKFSSKAAAAGVKAEFVKRNFPFENGSFIGGKEFMDLLKADDDYKAAFIVEKPAEPEPTPTPDPAPTPQQKPQFSSSKPQQPQPKPKVGLAELMRRKNENPNTPITFD